MNIHFSISVFYYFIFTNCSIFILIKHSQILKQVIHLVIRQNNKRHLLHLIQQQLLFDSNFMIRFLTGKKKK